MKLLEIFDYGTCMIFLIIHNQGPDSSEYYFIAFKRNMLLPKGMFLSMGIVLFEAKSLWIYWKTGKGLYTYVCVCIYIHMFYFIYLHFLHIFTQLSSQEALPQPPVYTCSWPNTSLGLHYVSLPLTTINILGFICFVYFLCPSNRM